MDSSTLDTFEIQLDWVLGQSCLDCAFDRQGWSWVLEVPSKLGFHEFMKSNNVLPMLC